MDDFSKRLGEVEKAVVEIRTKLDTALPQLATKAELHAVRVEIGGLRSDMNEKLGSLRSDMNAHVGSLRSDMNAMETRILKWMVGTMISGMALAVAIAHVLSRFF
jgi:hypothetical protein